MKCIFFGASGYIGRHLVSALREAGHDVNVPTKPDNHRIDLTEGTGLSGIDWNVDFVFLFAGVTGTGVSFDQFDKFVLGNELVLLNVLDAIRRSGCCPRVIFPSSRLVYRGDDVPLTETAQLEAKTLYAVNKIACEHILRAYSNAFAIPHTILRICVPYANLIGNQYSFGTVGNFIMQATKAAHIRLYGDGQLRRTFTHIDDLCQLTIAAAVHPGAANQTFNMPGEDLSLLEVASLIADRMGAAIESVEWPSFDARIESGSTVFDGVKLLNLLNTSLRHRLFDWAAKIVPTVKAPA